MKRFILFPAMMALLFVLTACGHDNLCEIRVLIDVNTAAANTELVRPLQLGYTANIGVLRDGYQRLSDGELSIVGDDTKVYGQTMQDVETGAENARKAAEAALFGLNGKCVHIVSTDKGTAFDVEVVSRVMGTPHVTHYYKIVED